MYRHLLLLSISFLLLAGCDNSTSVDEEINIRIQNNSSYAMSDVVAAFPEQEVSYGDIDVGEQTSYHTVTEAYRYAYIEATIKGEQAILQPIYYVGESLLEPGRYTYQLDAEKSENSYSLSLTLE